MTVKQKSKNSENKRTPFAAQTRKYHARRPWRQAQTEQRFSNLHDERANGHRSLVRVLTASVVSFAALRACKQVAGVIETTTRHRV